MKTSLSHSPKKALALISGGLDSLLAAKVIMEQNIHVEGVNFFTGFTGDTPPELKSQIPEKLHENACTKLTEQLGIKLHIIDISESFKTVMQHPQYGFGSNYNPCLDCKLFMVNCAKKYLDKLKFDFLVTGEVIGQRPKSQRKDTLPIIAKDTEDLLLRPLCARLLPETFMEKQGWVDRNALYNISGRSRKMQIKLAKHFKINNYPQPAGGCILTDKGYCSRLHDLWQHQVKNSFRQVRHYSLNKIMLAKLGRHLRFTPNFKLIIGRDENDNNALHHYKDYFAIIKTPDYPCALILLVPTHDVVDDFSVSSTQFELVAQIAARFSKGKDQEKVKVEVQWPQKPSNTLEVTPLQAKDMQPEWYI